MGGKIENIASFIKGMLGSVSVVEVPVNDQNTL